MTDLLSAIREFRSLEEKRRAGGLSGEEQERWDQLRGILGERTPAPLDVPGSQASPAGTPAAPPQAAASSESFPVEIEEEPPMVDADLLEEEPVAGPAPPAAAPPLVSAPAPAIAFAGWPMADAPAAPIAPPEAAEPSEPADALAGWPMTEAPASSWSAPPAPAMESAPSPWPPAEQYAAPPPPPEPPPPSAPPEEAGASMELQSGDDALASVTDFLVQAPLVAAPAVAPQPVSPWPPAPPVAPPPVSPWPPAPPAVVASAPPPAPAPSQWFAPSPPAPAPAPPEPPTWPEPAPRADRAVWPARINTAPPWPAAEPAAPVAPPAAADPDQDLPVAVEPVAMEPDAMDLLSETHAPSPKPSTKSGVFVEGEHRVVVHTLVGALKRGTIRNLDLESPTLELSPQSGGDSEWVPSEELKAIFFMLPPGQPHLAQAGQRLTVTFHDGRQITGFSTDYRPGDPGFFLIPADTRSATARIYVFRAALRDVMAN